MIECRGIVKRFPGVTALDRVSFIISQKKITGVLGENGAGKSTLMNILFGLVQPDEGVMLLDGKVYHPRNPSEAMSEGVGMVHQNQMLIDDFSVTENIILGERVDNAAGIIDFKAAESSVREIFKDLDSSIDPGSPVSGLDPFDRQTLELAKVLYRNARLIILDEPTALLAPRQIDMFFRILKDLKKKGKTIILVTHRIAEIEAAVDNVMILSKGKLVEHCPVKTVNRDELVSLIITGSRKTLDAGSILMEKRAGTIQAGKRKKGIRNAQVFEFVDVSTLHSSGGRHLENLNLKVCKGEIVGITGVPGNGQQHLLELAAGLRRLTGGKINFDGNEVSPAELKEIRKKPIGYIFPQRDEQGLILSFSFEENLLLSRRRMADFSSNGWLKTNEIMASCYGAVKKFAIGNAVMNRPVSNLSGGNRQKLVLAREITGDVKLIVASEPSRGLDIKTTEELKKFFFDIKASGAGILLISGDLDFLFSISDRIGVIYKGAINYLMDSTSADYKSINRSMLGYK
jgi:ABC-type uncharacterized transport system ATPase subunit